MGDGISRRDFSKLAGLAGVAGVWPTDVGAQQSGSAPAPDAAPDIAPHAAPQPPAPDAYAFFTADEGAFVEAAVALLIPDDELGGGAVEAGVPVFIDRQLAGAYGTAGRWYMQVPWGPSVPEQGYQLPLTPRQLYRLGIEQINVHCRRALGHPFHELTADVRRDLLQQIEGGRLTMADVPLRTFFDMLLANTMEGFFSDPIHGGNRNKIGWRLVGFPGVAAAYVTEVGKFNVPYVVEPVGIADVLQGRVRVDAHGHPVHERLAGPEA